MAAGEEVASSKVAAGEEALVVDSKALMVWEVDMVVVAAVGLVTQQEVDP